MKFDRNCRKAFKRLGFLVLVAFAIAGGAVLQSTARLHAGGPTSVDRAVADVLGEPRPADETLPPF